MKTSDIITKFYVEPIIPEPCKPELRYMTLPGDAEHPNATDAEIKQNRINRVSIINGRVRLYQEGWRRVNGKISGNL